MNPKVADNLRNAVSDEEVYAAHHGRQIALFPNIAHNNKTTDQINGVARSGSPQPQKSAIKSAKSSDNIFASDSRETFDAYKNGSVGSGLESGGGAPSAKKKLSVRFEIPDGQEPPHREHKQRPTAAWQYKASSSSRQQQPINAEDLMVHYQRLRVRTSALRRSHSDRVTSSRGAAAGGAGGGRLTGSNPPSVAVKFSMNV